MRPWSCALAIVALLGGCDNSLEVRGQSDRVVGETVTFELVRGDPGFSGELVLEATGGATYDGAQLAVDLERETQLSFVIPAGIAQGRARVRAEMADGSGNFEVPLEINRLALTVDADGLLEVLPLSPATLKQDALNLGSPAKLALTPGGGAAVILTEELVRIVSLGKTLRDASAGIRFSGGTAVASLPDGALLATPTSLVLIRFRQQTTQSTIPFSGCRALAMNAAGTIAVALAPCDTDDEEVSDGECLFEIAVGETLEQKQRVVLPGAAGASAMDLSTDGKGVVVADSAAIFGVWLDAIPPRVTTIPWGQQASPVDIAHAEARVQNLVIDLFTIADAADQDSAQEGVQGRLKLVGFNPDRENDLQEAGEVRLPEAPVAIDYGRRTDLYVAAGKNIYLLDVAEGSPEVHKLEFVLAQPIVDLVVQP